MASRVSQPTEADAQDYTELYVAQRTWQSFGHYPWTCQVKEWYFFPCWCRPLAVRHVLQGMSNLKIKRDL